jgi:V8-like Glu-specific endopeptidase
MNKKDIELLSKSEIPESVRVAIVQQLTDFNNEKTNNQLEHAKLELERKKVFLNTPLVAALAGLITLSVTFLFDSFTRNKDTEHTITLEQVKQELKSSETRTDAAIEASEQERAFQYEIVKSELADENKSNIERASVLLFLSRAGILNTLNQIELKKMAIEQQAKPEENIIPRLQVSSKSKDLSANEVKYISEASWQAALMSKKSNMQQCGAVLISGKWALTNAHCVSSNNPKDLYVNYGSLNQNNAVKNNVVEIHIHPNFDQMNISFDAALLKLENTIAPIKPIELAKTGEVLPIGDFLRIFGWWSISKMGFTLEENMLYEDVLILSNQICESLTSNSSISFDSTSMFCVGQRKEGINICGGSSGSSAVMKNIEGDYKLIGMPSWGTGCGNPNSLDVYTRVSSITDWVYEIMNTN